MQKKTVQNDSENFINTSDSTLCGQCKRPLSAKTGQCYYCSEADPEAVKNLNFLMLEWQQQAARDPDSKAQNRAINVLSILFAISAAASFAIGFLPAGTNHLPGFTFILIGLISGLLAWSFHFNSLLLLTASLFHTALMFFYINLAFKSLPTELLNAFFSGFIATISAVSIIMITLRIFKNKAIQL